MLPVCAPVVPAAPSSVSLLATRPGLSRLSRITHRQRRYCWCSCALAVAVPGSSRVSDGGVVGCVGHSLAESGVIPNARTRSRVWRFEIGTQARTTPFA